MIRPAVVSISEHAHSTFGSVVGKMLVVCNRRRNSRWPGSFQADDFVPDMVGDV